MNQKSLNLIVFFVLVVLFVACGPAEEPAKEDHESHEVVLMTVEGRLDNIHDELKMVKAEMTKDGSYDCCVQPGCDWCVLHEGECECHDNLTASKEVCPGCGLGWHNGKGVVQGVDAKKVKWNIVHEHGAGEHEKRGHSEGEPKEGGLKH